MKSLLQPHECSFFSFTALKEKGRKNRKEDNLKTAGVILNRKIPT